MQALVRHKERWECINFEYISKGDIFRQFDEENEPVTEGDLHIWRALSNPVKDGDNWIIAKESVTTTELQELITEGKLPQK